MNRSGNGLETKYTHISTSGSMGLSFACQRSPVPWKAYFTLGATGLALLIYKMRSKEYHESGTHSNDFCGWLHVQARRRIHRRDFPKVQCWQTAPPLQPLGHSRRRILCRGKKSMVFPARVISDLRGSSGPTGILCRHAVGLVHVGQMPSERDSSIPTRERRGGSSCRCFCMEP